MPYLPKERQAEQTALNELAQKISTEMATPYMPIGQAWVEALETAPNINLYASDDFSPSFEGTYLTACVLYEVLSKDSCLGLPTQFQISRLPKPLSYAIDETTAQQLQTIAHHVVQSLN